MDDVLITNQPVVIDNGSGYIKAGFSGGEQPKCIFPNFLGTPKHVRVMTSVSGDVKAAQSHSLDVGAGASHHHTREGTTDGARNRKKEWYVGRHAEERRGLLRLSYPMEHGIVTDWTAMEKVWSEVYRSLGTEASEHPVLLTEAPLNPRQNRERAAEIFFEHFGVPAFFVSVQAVLSLYASGRTTGLVLDSGDGVTHAVPIFDGFALPNAIRRIDIAGRDVTERLEFLLRRSGYDFHTSAEREIVRGIKEQACYVAVDPAQEEELLSSTSARGGSSQSLRVKYRLPDGQQIEVGGERFRAPEVLFRPHLIGEEFEGVHECVANSIRRADIDLRRELYANIVLSGGSTMFPGFGQRLLNEVKSLAPPDTKLKIIVPPERKSSTWTGGSILASLGTFKNMWISQSAYKEYGASILHQRTF
eukprot:CAMPEP_0177636916 /NCGR_PEP_ID=MMETSP0447-20121125/4694_1 /TAXON_ID=0 /ORGANISM="Stygamoeba regulata, Strain BSH-02190019" /LENGTH=417 /DNA_ID=CAMNT_0019138811 /DNA_START=63 /DNA_END=1316 /DNA_ORIENTATION=+